MMFFDVFYHIIFIESRRRVHWLDGGIFNIVFTDKMTNMAVTRLV